MGQQNDTKKTISTTDKLLKITNIILVLIIVLLIIAIFLFVFVFSSFKVFGASMQNTFFEGDRFFLLKIGYSIERGDIIVFKEPNSADKIVKRVIAISGDTIRFDLEKKTWFLNDNVLIEPYAYFGDYATYTNNYFDLNNENEQNQHNQKILVGEGLTVPEDQLFVLGDNRSVSYDSHNYGCIQTNYIIGKMLNHKYKN